MSEEVRLPPGLLPREKHYRPQRPGRTSAAIVLLAAIVAAYLVCWVLGHLWLWWAMNVEPWYVVSAVAACYVGRALWHIVRTQAVVTENYDAAALLETGKAAEAGAKLDDLCRRAVRNPPVHAMVVYNRGVAYLRAGQSDRALSLFAAVLDCGVFEKSNSSLHAFYSVLLTQVAAASALQGETETAERWQGLAHDHVTAARAGFLLPVDVILGIRTGRNEVVVRDAEADWATTGCLPGREVQSLRILCAFGLSQKNHNGIHDERIRKFLDGAWPCSPGQFDYLAVNWPELRAFLEHSELSAKAGQQGE